MVVVVGGETARAEEGETSKHAGFSLPLRADLSSL